MSSTRMLVVSHTHWDREWQLSFQQFRARLVEMMDALLALLEREPCFDSFALDGQTVLLEDYLEVQAGETSGDPRASAPRKAARRSLVHLARRIPRLCRKADPQPYVGTSHRH